MDVTDARAAGRPAGDGVSSQPVETLLTRRALDLLASGPADSVTLIEYVCQMPGAPRTVAEQMAFALFAGRTEFLHGADGRWALAPARAAERCIAERETPRADELAHESYVVVDLETTGMRAWAGDRITEVGAVVVREGRIVHRYETLVNPERPIPPMISALTHITADMVRHAPRFRDVCDEVLGVVEGHVFVAHNAQFDWRFLSAEVERATGRRLTGRRLCTVKLARRVLPHLRSRRLDSLAHYYDVDIVGRHRAGGDAHATARIFLKLLDEARARDCRAWDDLQRLLRVPRAARRRRSALPQPVDRDPTV